MSNELRAFAKAEAERLGLDWGIADRLIQAESSWNPKAIGPVLPKRDERAIGLTQLLPSTARDLRVDPYDAKQNITGGLTYLKQNLDRYGGDYVKALASHNWGPNAVAKYGMEKAPLETRNYVSKIMGSKTSALDSAESEFISSLGGKGGGATKQQESANSPYSAAEREFLDSIKPAEEEPLKIFVSGVGSEGPEPQTEQKGALRRIGGAFVDIASAPTRAVYSGVKSLINSPPEPSSASSQQTGLPLAAQDPTKMLDGEQRLQRAYNTMAQNNSFFGNVRDGMATAAQRYALGGSQMIGRATPEQKQELQLADKAFGSTVGGKVGDFIGTALPAVAATFVPGGNTILGQALIAGGMGAAQPADSIGERAANAAIGTGLGAAAKVGGDKLANYIAGRAAQRTAGLTAQNSVRDGTIAEARAAGYTIPPSSANPSFLNRAAEGFAGKISTAQSAAIKNQAVTDNLARKALGLADDMPLTKETLQGVREAAGKMYAPVEALGRINADSAYKSALQAVERRFSPAVSDFPDLANKEVGALVKALDKPDFDSSSAVKILQSLREKATDNLGPTASGSDKALGRAQKDLASALESMLERHAQSVGQTDAVQALREARTLIAKSYTVEKALREGAGSVSASKLASQLKAGKPLTDELLTAAKVGQVFPRATQDITSSMPGVSPLDFGLAGGLSALTANPLLMATVVGRPAVRAAILSQPYQRAMVGAPSYAPGLLGSSVPPMLRNRAAQMSLTGGLLDAATR
jgi:soluble lytic murein transglycosylase-like protein